MPWSQDTMPWRSDGEPTPLQSGAVWRGKLTVRRFAGKERVDSSYVSRMVNLTMLGPDIVAAMLDETLPPDLTLFELAVDPPALWEAQRNRIEGMMPNHELNLAADTSGGFRAFSDVRNPPKPAAH